MALWRDPLDELIDDLERALPPDARGTLQILPIEDVQALMCAILYSHRGEPRPRLSGARGATGLAVLRGARQTARLQLGASPTTDTLEAAHRTIEPISDSVQSAMYWYVR